MHHGHTLEFKLVDGLRGTVDAAGHELGIGDRPPFCFSKYGPRKLATSGIGVTHGRCSCLGVGYSPSSPASGTSSGHPSVDVSLSFGHSPRAGPSLLGPAPSVVSAVSLSSSGVPRL